VEAFVSAGAGFLLAVLWFDLMFDVQAAGRPGDPLPQPVLVSISGYYRRVTTKARPMNRLVMVAMGGTLAAIGLELARGQGPLWMRASSPVLALPPMVLAGIRTVPNAVRLGTGSGGAGEQSALARSILRDHVCCAVAIAALLGVQLAASF
jgi:hypothetical protein